MSKDGIEERNNLLFVSSPRGTCFRLVDGIGRLLLLLLLLVGWIDKGGDFFLARFRRRRRRRPLPPREVMRYKTRAFCGVREEKDRNTCM